jgi:hypothetical protein
VFWKVRAAHVVAANWRMSSWRRRGETIGWRSGGERLQTVMCVALGGRWDRNFVEDKMVRA